jgi:cardiolipin synthase
VITALGSAGAAVVLTRNFLEVEKRIDRLIPVDYGPEDPRFRRTMSQLLGPPLLEGNSVTALQNGAQIFPAMLAAIQEAKRSISFENFIFHEGTITNQFAEALAERARAGVKVHFLQDAFGCDCLHGAAMHLLKRSGVEVEIFRFLHLTRFNYRTHRKLLVIDGRAGFVGGVGIGDEWDGNGNSAHQWRDSHYRVEGPVVAQMQQAFMDNWMQTRAVVLHGDDYFPELAPTGDTLCQVFKSSASEGADSARVMFLLSIAAARRTIRIANAYFIPDDFCLQTLVEACERGVKVEIITPGPNIDMRVVRIVGRSRWEPLLQAGARFYEFQPARYHCKYMIVDERWVTVGSANFDNRSLRLNEEVNLNVLDSDLAAQQIRIFDADKSQSHEITIAAWRRRPLSERMIGRSAGVLRSQM